MEAITTRRHKPRPITEAWDAVKGLDYSDKLELVTMIIDSVKPAQTDTLSMEQMIEGYPHKRYTMNEINTMLDEAEAEIAAGKGIPDEEAWRKYDEGFDLEDSDMDKELYTPEEAYEMTMKDIKAIYGK